MWRDPKTFIVIRLISPIVYLTFQSYLAASIVLAWLSYFGTWRLFKFFLIFYPKMEKELAIATLFIPSVIFWGSGILKDTFTYAATCWFIYSVFKALVVRQQIISNSIAIIITSILIIAIKPYIFVALLPGTIVWMFFNQLKSIKNTFVRILVIPFTLTFFTFGGLLIFGNIQENLGVYGDVDKMLDKAKTTKEDLTREEQYGKNYYDLGDIEWTPLGIIKVAPMALAAGLYRPFIWEARSIVIILSGIENAILLYLTIWLMIKVGFIRFFRNLFSEPIMMFSTLFSWTFLFSVGISTANFGALVRYKIPALPFFLVSLFIMKHLYEIKKESINP